MKMKNIAAVAMAGCMAASLAACGGSASSAATDASSAASTEAATSEATEATGTSANGFTVQYGPNPETLDPALNSSIDGANTIITTFEPLLLIDENNEVVPGQAEMPEVSEGHRPCDGICPHGHLRPHTGQAPAGADREDRSQLLFPRPNPGSTSAPAKRKTGGNKNLR